jgi:Ca-activated chloride channel homolog
MRKAMIGAVLVCLVGCGTTTPQAVTPVVGDAGSKPAASVATASSTSPPEVPAAPASSTWIGASAASDAILAGGGETFMGVWVDVPTAVQKARAPIAISLVIDTSGSMAGPKIEHARAAARSLVKSLSDGDVVSIHTFSDEAQERVPPTVLDGTSRRRIDATIAELGSNGGTNLFDGMRMGASRAIHAPPTHLVRRVVLISDGMATVGPTTPDVIGALAARSADQGAQVTAIGVGLEYDENTLNALAIRSSGRLYHLGEPREMASMLDRELKLLQQTMAAGAFVDIVPAPGVQIIAAEGIRADAHDGGLRVPLGAMFGGQRREMLVRVRVTDTTPGTRPLASVRLHFKDPAENGLERVQEVVARFEVTQDPLVVERRRNSRTQEIIAMNEVARGSAVAAQQVNSGDFAAADRQLAQTEEKLKDSAKKATDARERDRILSAAGAVSSSRRAAAAVSAAPPAARPAAKRAMSLEMNDKAMDASGF